MKKRPYRKRKQCLYTRMSSFHWRTCLGSLGGLRQQSSGIYLRKFKWVWLKDHRRTYVVSSCCCHLALNNQYILKKKKKKKGICSLVKWIFDLRLNTLRDSYLPCTHKHLFLCMHMELCAYIHIYKQHNMYHNVYLRYLGLLTATFF